MNAIAIGCWLFFMPFTAEAAETSCTHMTQLPGDLTEVQFFDQAGHLIQKGYLLDGQKSGVWETYDVNGKLSAKAYYENGVKEGKWKIYDHAGNLTYKIYYKHNHKVWAQSFNGDGEVTSVAIR